MIFVGKYWYMLEHGLTVKTLCSETEAHHKISRFTWFYLYETSRLSKSIVTEGRLVVAESCGEGREGLLVDKVGFWVGGFVYVCVRENT